MGSFQLEYQDNQTSFSFTNDSVTIGRDESSDFVLDHPTVSRQHAQIVDDGGGRYRLVVLSRNGLTALDGERLRDSAELTDGSRIHFGKLEFVFRADEARSPHASDPHDAPRGREPRHGADRGHGTDRGRGDSPRASEERRGQTSAPTGGANDPSFEAESDPGAMPDLVDKSSDETGEPPSHDTPRGEDSLGDLSGESSVGENSHEQESEDEGELQSWDDIAATAGDDSADGGDTTGAGASSGGKRSASSSLGEEAEEETDPKVVIVGLGLAVAFLAYSFWPAGGDNSGANQGSSKGSKVPYLVMEVTCMGTDDCRRKAISAYKSGVGYFERRSAKIGNLFKAYRKLYEAQKYLEAGKISETPPELKKLSSKKKMIRKKLDDRFRGFKVDYHIAKKESRYDDMARVLLKIQRHFPDERSREYKWARERKRKMKDDGNYPSEYEIRQGL